jgi:hypothetical protein
MAETNASDDDRPQIASVFASLKKGAERAGPAPPLVTQPTYAPPEIKALYPRLDETTSLEDARRREKERNAGLIKPNRRAMRPQRDWPALAFPKLKKTIEPHVPLPKALAWTGLRTNRYARDDPVLRYVPYFGDDDTTGVDVAAYDEGVQAPRPSEGLCWAAAASSELQTCREDPRAVSAALEAARNPRQKKAVVKMDAMNLRQCKDYASLANSYQSLFCRRCFVYDCANHGVGQPLSRERVDPDVVEDDAARELAESSIDLREAYRREQRRNDLPRGDHAILVKKASAVFRDDASLRRALGFVAERAGPVPLLPQKKRKLDRCMLFKRQRLLLEHGGKRGKKEKYVCCDHEGPCDDPKICPCVARNGFCEKYCACASDCRARYPGCDGLHCGTERNDCFLLGRECDPDVCACRGECAANALRTNRHARVVLGRSQVHGWGAFALKPVKKGDLVGEYRGELVSQDEADRRGKIYDKLSCSFLFDLDDELVVDATRKGAKLKFANHHPQPNLIPRVMFVDGDHRVGLYAARSIESNEELCFDYSAEFWSAAAREASCPGAGA